MSEKPRKWLKTRRWLKSSLGKTISFWCLSIFSAFGIISQIFEWNEQVWSVRIVIIFVVIVFTIRYFESLDELDRKESLKQLRKKRTNIKDL